MAIDTMKGRKLGNYVVTRLLGQGGMGSVYQARHPEIGREVAIKVMDRVGPEEMPKRFVDEARAATQIVHPNIIDVYDLGRTEEGWIYYVMEKLVGRDLAAIMDEAMEQQGRMMPQQVQPLLEQICLGLQAAHDANIVHRDLKPENVFVLDGEPLRLKLLDFGIAKLLERETQGNAHTQAGVILGTPLVIAPEQIPGRRAKVSHRSDIYSLGILLYWMLAGRPPFMDEDLFALVTKHVSDLAVPLEQLMPDLPAELTALVMQCIEKAPKDRPDTALEVHRRFKEAMDAISFEDGPTPVAMGLPEEEDFTVVDDPDEPESLVPSVAETRNLYGRPATIPPAAPGRGRIGQVLKQTYRLERQIGQGTLGVVYEASHTRISRRFAIKLLHSGLATNQAALEAFRREAEVTSKLGHDNIVQVVDFDYSKDVDPFIVMELLRGEDLAQRLSRERRLDLETTLSILTQVASAVGAAHEAGVVHRHLKPTNVFLCRHKRPELLVKVLDFGISKVVGSHKPSDGKQPIRSSLQYLAPEQALSGEVDHRVDVYAAGSLLYCMLAGHAPFWDRAPQRVRESICGDLPRSLTRVLTNFPRQVDEVVQRALSKDPDQRYESIQLLASALERAVMRAMSESFLQRAPVNLDVGPETFPLQDVPLDDQPTRVKQEGDEVALEFDDELLGDTPVDDPTVPSQQIPEALVAVAQTLAQHGVEKLDSDSLDLPPGLDSLPLESAPNMGAAAAAVAAAQREVAGEAAAGGGVGKRREPRTTDPLSLPPGLGDHPLDGDGVGPPRPPSPAQSPQPQPRSPLQPQPQPPPLSAMAPPAAAEVQLDTIKEMIPPVIPAAVADIPLDSSNLSTINVAAATDQRQASLLRWAVAGALFVLLLVASAYLLTAEMGWLESAHSAGNGAVTVDAALPDHGLAPHNPAE